MLQQEGKISITDYFQERFGSENQKSSQKGRKQKKSKACKGREIRANEGKEKELEAEVIGLEQREEQETRTVVQSRGHQQLGDKKVGTGEIVEEHV